MRSIASSASTRHLLRNGFLANRSKKNNNNLFHSSPENVRAAAFRAAAGKFLLVAVLLLLLPPPLSRWFSLSLFLPMVLFTIFSIVPRQVERILSLAAVHCTHIHTHSHSHSLNWLIFYSLVRFLFRNCFHVQRLLFISIFIARNLSRSLFHCVLLTSSPGIERENERMSGGWSSCVSRKSCRLQDASLIFAYSFRFIFGVQKRCSRFFSSFIFYFFFFCVSSTISLVLVVLKSERPLLMGII